jgi:hypothetical protein
MYDQTQSQQPFGMGGSGSSSTGYGGGAMQDGQSDEAGASRRLRVRVAGTALFTVGIAALGYSMVEKSMDGEDGMVSSDTTDAKSNGSTSPSKLEVAASVKDELSEEFLNPRLEHGPITPITQENTGPKTPEPPKQQPTAQQHTHMVGPDGLHDFSGCGSFSQAFAHARAELGGPGEIFIYRGKPYTTTYKHEAEEGNETHFPTGFEVEMVLVEGPDGSKIIAADSDKDGKADKWYYEDNGKRCELIDRDGDGKFDAFTDTNGDVITLNKPIEPEPTTIPPTTYDIVTMDNVEFLAYGEPGKYVELVGEYDGKILTYKDTDGDGKLDHASFSDYNSQTMHEWDITPMSVENGDIDIPDDIENALHQQSTSSTITGLDDTFIGPPEDEPIIDENDMAALNDDPYRVDIENEINSGDFNNHSDVSAFGN